MIDRVIGRSLMGLQNFPDLTALQKTLQKCRKDRQAPTSCQGFRSHNTQEKFIDIYSWFRNPKGLLGKSQAVQC